MDENTTPAYQTHPSTSYNSSSDSEVEDEEQESETSGSRRLGMRFSSIQDFLASLNTATTAMTNLQGMQSLSLESYKKCMPGAQLETKPGEVPPQLKNKITKIERMEPDIKDN